MVNNFFLSLHGEKKRLAQTRLFVCLLREQYEYL